MKLQLGTKFVSGFAFAALIGGIGVNVLAAQAQQLQASIAFFKVGSDSRQSAHHVKNNGHAADHSVKFAGMKPARAVPGHKISRAAGKDVVRPAAHGANGDSADKEFERS